MSRKNRLPLRYIVLIIVVIITIVLGIIFSVVKDDRSLHPVEKLIKDTGLFVQKIVNKPVEFVKSKINEYQKRKTLYKDYLELEKKVAEIELNNAKRRELEKELTELKKLLGITETLSSQSYLNATVVNRNVGYWYNTITINKGEYNGVTKDMAVINSEGLVGRVIHTTEFNSTVKLLTTDDLNSKISVKIDVNGNYVYGLLTGYDRESNKFIVEGIDDYSDIPVGSVVTTTGLGDLFPSGILVGKVVGQKTDHFDLAKTIEIESPVNFNDLSFVTVLKREAKVDD